jgi:hypothetical protein
MGLRLDQPQGGAVIPVTRGLEGLLLPVVTEVLLAFAMGALLGAALRPGRTRVHASDTCDRCRAARDWEDSRPPVSVGPTPSRRY